MSDELVKPIKIGLNMNKQIGLAKRAADIKSVMKDIDPQTVLNRIGMVFDDSGSMGESLDVGQSKLDMAKKGTTQFIGACNAMDTSIAFYPMNGEKRKLLINYGMINMFIASINRGNLGGTPLYTALGVLIDNEPITRAVLFSDGEPTDNRVNYWNEEEDKPTDKLSLSDRTIQKYIDKKISVDTVFLGHERTPGYKVMEEIAKKTDGIFLHFKDGASFGNSFKYLAPATRFMLMDDNTRKKVERGESI